MEQTLRGVRVAVIAANGFDLTELMETKQMLEAAGAATFLLSSTGTTVQPGTDKANMPEEGSIAPTFTATSDEAPGAVLATDGDLTNCDPSEYDAVYIAGGRASTATLQNDAQAISLLQGINGAGKPIAAGRDTDALLGAAGATNAVSGAVSDAGAFAHRVIEAFGQGASPSARQTGDSGDTLATDEQGLSGGRGE